MRELTQIAELYRTLQAEAVPCALATVVAIEGSSYRRIGARLLVATDGRYAGGISGGCLEGDAKKRAKRAILAGRPTIQVYDTLEGEDAVIGVGLGCNGRIDVLFSPLPLTAGPENPLTLLTDLAASGDGATLVQVIGGAGWENHAGRLYPFSELDRLVAATNLSSETLDEIERLANNRSRVLEGMTRRGASVRLLIEHLRPRPNLTVVGYNYDVYPLLQLLQLQGWSYDLVGPLRHYTPAVVRAARRHVEYGDVAKLRLGPADNVALMTHDYATDLRLLPEILAAEVGYLGLLGPRKRTAKLTDDLLASTGVSLANYPNLHAPIGLDIGAETPGEIALAIVSEVTACRRERSGGFLRDGRGPIHQREPILTVSLP